jgi:Concanavalin A-like lectin/glucanases superfamily
VTLFLAPLLILLLVAVLGFIGCTKDFDSLGEGEPPGGDGPPDGPPNGPPPEPDKTYKEHVLADGPAAFWRLGDASTNTGDIAKDEIGPAPTGANPGTYHAGTPIAGAAGPPPSAAAPGDVSPGGTNLDLSDPGASSILVDGGYVSVPVAGHPELAPPEFTVELLVATSSWDSMALRVVACSVDDAANLGWALYARADNFWEARLWDGTQSQTITGDAVDFRGRFEHLALTYASGGVAIVWVNGVPHQAASSIPFLPNTQQPLYIGVGVEGTTPHWPFAGLIQEVALYPTPLADIPAHYMSNQ